MVVKAHAIVGCFYSATKHVVLIHRKKKCFFSEQHQHTSTSLNCKHRLQHKVSRIRWPGDKLQATALQSAHALRRAEGEMRGEQGWACVINEELIGKIWENNVMQLIILHKCVAETKIFSAPRHPWLYGHMRCGPAWDRGRNLGYLGDEKKTPRFTV